uniref:Uncharacterized protein n=1 Tax=Seriola lalandi dorsalis TaxID=1841481 RepID=A0A3B4WFM2_SERLL
MLFQHLRVLIRIGFATKIFILFLKGVAGIYCHCGFDLQLGQLHTVVENPEELF